MEVDLYFRNTNDAKCPNKLAYINNINHLPLTNSLKAENVDSKTNVDTNTSMCYLSSICKMLKITGRIVKIFLSIKEQYPHSK